MKKITRFELTIEACVAIDWPHFSGSTLRGAFGRALRKASCVTKQPTCNGCSVRNTCSYGAVFDPTAPVKPLHPSFRDGIPQYVLQPPPFGSCNLKPGDLKTFSLIFFPGIEAHLKLIEYIFKSTVEHELLSKGTFRLLNTKKTKIEILDECTSEFDDMCTDSSTVNIRWVTPLRLQRNGKPIFKADLVDMHIFIRALLRRQLQWCQLTQQSAPDSSSVLASASKCSFDTNLLRWHDIERFSSSQNKKIPLGGLMGLAQLKGPVNALKLIEPLLQLGELLHIGKETVLGLGQYQLSLDKNACNQKN
jgi:hypothetical protein